MNGTKAAVASVGIWGGVIATMSPIIMMLIQVMGGNSNPVIAGIAGILGGIMAIIGRVTATKQITGVLVTPPNTSG
jgi:hypothetical protein